MLFTFYDFKQQCKQRCLHGQRLAKQKLSHAPVFN